MIIIGKIENRFIVLLNILLAISLIGCLDYFSGGELSFSIFYLIPISFLALYRGTKLSSVLISSFYASLLWFLADYSTNQYSAIFFPVWNAFVRLIIFNIVGWLLIFLKEKDKKLNELNIRLTSINDEKNKMLGMAAHDLRNPIGGIYSYSDLIIENYKDTMKEEVLEAIVLMRTMSQNTLEVLKNLLDVSKIEAGKVDLKIKTQDYISFLIIQIFQNQLLANKKKINIQLKTQDEIIPADFDKQYMSEVIDNLISNAIKYSFENSEIIVKVSRTENNQIHTEVIDKGKGIREEEQKNLFEYFHKTSTSPTGGESSTGLGLAIAKRVVVLHQGQMGVKSTLNQGSNFYFTFPIARKNLSAQESN